MRQKISMSSTTCTPQRVCETKRVQLTALLFMASIQYFLVQYVVAQRWPRPYSITRNTISDLGSTVCGTFNTRYVCSPWHSSMDASFVLLGLTMMMGCGLMWYSNRSSRVTSTGFAGLCVGGLGVVVVGVVPENSVPLVHGAGAALPFLVGNIGILLIGFGRQGSRHRHPAQEGRDGARDRRADGEGEEALRLDRAPLCRQASHAAGP